MNFTISSVAPAEEASFPGEPQAANKPVSSQKISEQWFPNLLKPVKSLADFDFSCATNRMKATLDDKYV